MGKRSAFKHHIQKFFMENQPEVEMRRLGHLTEVVNMAAKYMIAEKGAPTEVDILGYTAGLDGIYNDPLFKVYRDDESELARDFQRALNILENNGILSRGSDSYSKIVPKDPSSMHSVVAYSSLQDKLFDVTATIKL